jgi:hypothetical protein
MDTDLWRSLQALVQHLGRVPSSLDQRIEIPTSTTGLPVPGRSAECDAGGHCITPNREGIDRRRKPVADDQDEAHSPQRKSNNYRTKQNCQPTAETAASHGSAGARNVEYRDLTDRHVEPSQESNFCVALMQTPHHWKRDHLRGSSGFRVAADMR